MVLLRLLVRSGAPPPGDPPGGGFRWWSPGVSPPGRAAGSPA